MIRLLSGWVMLGLMLLVAACSPVEVVTTAAQTTSPIPQLHPTNTPPPTEPAATPSTAPVDTPTPPPFNPQSCAQEACSLDELVLMERPVPDGAQRSVDGSYLYGTTQNGQRIAHSGVEFYNASGTPVLAAADGRVVYAGNDEETAFAPWTHFYGNLVILEHTPPDGNRLYTLYAHLSEINTKQGASVRTGQSIGAVGMSGSAIGSHLHFEVRTDPYDYTTTRNPLLFLAPLTGSSGQGLAALAGRLLDQNGHFISTPQLVVERVDLPQNAAPQRYYIETYEPGVAPDPIWQENFALTDLDPGQYRISFVYNGQLMERFITLTNRKLTYIALQVEN